MTRKKKMQIWTTEDDKLVTLAKGARSRVGAASGAAVRDTTGRTYANAEVSTGYLQLTAIELTVAQAIASGAVGIEAVVVCSEVTISPQDKEIIAAFAGIATPIYHVNIHGERIDAE